MNQEKCCQGDGGLIERECPLPKSITHCSPSLLTSTDFLEARAVHLAFLSPGRLAAVDDAGWAGTALAPGDTQRHRLLLASPEIWAGSQEGRDKAHPVSRVSPSHMLFISTSPAIWALSPHPASVLGSRAVSHTHSALRCVPGQSVWVEM